jgi:hypothetical protein
MPTYPFQLPTAASVRQEADLRPEQVSIELVSEAALEADIGQRITRKAALVAGKLARASSPFVWPFSDAAMAIAYPDYDSDQIEAELDTQKELATQAVSLYTQESLYRSARQWDQVNAVKAEIEELMGGLIESISFVTGMQPSDAPSNGVAVWTIGTGDSYDCDEYSSSC